MKKCLLVSLCVLFTCITFAQKTKTSVIVFGATPAGLAAAIQSAHSGVKTLLVDNSAIDVINLSDADKAYKIGVYAEFLKRVDSLQKKSNLHNNKNLLPAYVATVFKSWTDTIKNLTVFRKAILTKIEKDGKGWEIEFKDKREVKADIVVDATSANQILKETGFSLKLAKRVAGVYPDKIYRTSIAIKEFNGISPSGIPVADLFVENSESLIAINQAESNMLIGQGAGAAAAYCAFFKTGTKKLDVRKTQGELLGFKSQVIKFDDIALADSNAVSIQKIAITGILKGKLKGSQFLFLPDSTVSTEDIRLPVKEYYSRSHIWFLDHKADKLTLEDALSLIKFTGSRGNELDKEVEKNWKLSLKLTGKFDLKNSVTRKQLAVLLDFYLKPFERSIDLNGNLKN